MKKGHQAFDHILKHGSNETKKWFDQSRRCLTENHSELTAQERAIALSEIGAGRTSTYDHEDWSDLVSTIGGSTKGNMACAFYSEFVELGMMQDFTLKQFYPNDPHSTPFFRLLSNQARKPQGLPRICQQAVRAMGYNPEFKNCLQLEGVQK